MSRSANSSGRRKQKLGKNSDCHREERFSRRRDLDRAKDGILTPSRCDEIAMTAVRPRNDRKECTGRANGNENTCAKPRVNFVASNVRANAECA